VKETEPCARARDLLIIDDDPGQAHLFRHLLQELGLQHRCHHAASGLEGLDFLRRRKAHGNAPRPELIILDFNMPGMNGCEVLSEIKGDPDLCCIPVIMFSAGIMEQDVSRCYAELANAYVQKPRDFETSLLVVKQIEHFWFHEVSLPGVPSP
jgi:CheY-like chemotaxis protein